MSLSEKDLGFTDFGPDSPHADAEQEIDLIELLYKMLEKFKYIVLSATLCAMLAGVYSFFIATPKYEATAKLYIVNSKDSALNLADLQIGSYLTTDYQEVFNTWEVHEMVIRALGLDYTYVQLEDMLTVKNPTNTRILNITVISDDPAEAKDIANAYAKEAKKYISIMMATDEPNILSSALQPVKPVSPNKTMNVLLGFVLGALLVVGIVAVQFILDDKVKTADDILRYVNVPTLAVVPVMDSGNTNGNVKKGKNKPKHRDQARREGESRP